MRNLILIRVNNAQFDSGFLPPPALEAAMGTLLGEWTKAGKFLSGEGLTPPSKGTRLRLGHGKLEASDGPFTESKEVIGGFLIVKTETKAEAVELTRAFLKLHEEIMGKDFEIECEVRPIEGE